VGARVLAIADAYDSMTSDNRYRRGMSHSQAVAELRRHSGTQFDPELVERFIGIVDCWSQRTVATDIQQSSEVALSIGAQIEGLVSALDSQNLRDMALLAARLKSTASALSATQISLKASELEQTLHANEDFIGAMQTATELLDLCRSTQVALLQRPQSLHH
jgi:HPt (histidine-containing phosphotransfer) domain-containing protein